LSFRFAASRACVEGRHHQRWANEGNTIVIEDTSISLMHARITRKNGEFYLKDLNSTNGTIVNGQPISEAKLQDLDRVRLPASRRNSMSKLLRPRPNLPPFP